MSCTKDLHTVLYDQCREPAGREAQPTVGIIDRQIVKSAEKGGRGLTLRARMRINASRARSARSWWIPRGSYSMP
ncbi:hypothetical protein BN873_580003 [Candidatus Competibacter denitrificans Run_A_D11]|uniref:Transposase n=1 Tax=Candidatus Competibacter denitrificans Run_A_D11 TaxID=1400863 RepID=W6MA40_9GAMM|nr:hypothetical protein BN873_580003 [Candidatus Competibacter denitrificans Run_A_D11]